MTIQEIPTILTNRVRELRVKIKSLAAEARIIRDEERRCRDSLTRTIGHDDMRCRLASSFASLRAHRVNDVRRESRYSLLAYALIRGKAFRATEAKSDAGKIDTQKLVGLVARFGLLRPEIAATECQGWLAATS